MPKSERRRALGCRMLVGGVAAGVCAIGVEGLIGGGLGWVAACAFSAYEAAAIWVVWPGNEA